MSRLTWVQPPDLVAHELVAAAHEGKDVSDVRRRWLAAGGQADAPRTGVGQPGSPSLRGLAEELLDELDMLPLPADLAEREPDDLAAICAGWPTDRRPEPGRPAGFDRVHGALLGRAAGCLLGKPVEKLPREGIREILQSQGRWPLTTWFTADGLPPDVAARWPWNRRSATTSLAEHIDGMPEDDDLNFCLVALMVLEQHGAEFGSGDVSDAWLAGLPGGRVFTAERVAYRNLLLGWEPPQTALVHNPFRDWIGAQIRTDVYGWACPGDPWRAAELAYRDAVVSHQRNGVYGAMAVAAMCAVAVVVDATRPDSAIEAVLAAGLAVVPPHSRYAAAVLRGAEVGRSDATDEACLDVLHAEFGHLHWVHVLNNAALLACSLVRSHGDLGRGCCLAVTGGWDTDSVGATVGSICGGLRGARDLPCDWVAPLRNRLASSLPGFDGIGFDELATRVLGVSARDDDA